jgi:hypothetical protein
LSQPQKRFSLEFNPAYSDAYTDQNRYLLLYGSAGSGKSRFISQKIVLRCLENKERFLCIRKVDRTIKESVFREIETVIDELPINVKKNKTFNSFVFDNGSEIITSGLDDVKKLKSISGITSIWIEEATDLDEDDFNQIDLRLRGTPTTYFQIIISFNPIDDSHWLKKKFFDTKVNESTIIQTTYKDNYFLDEDYIKLLEERLAYDESLYQCYVLGIWAHARTGGEYYSQFKYNNHVKECKYDPELPLHLTFDQNVVPYITCEVAQIVKRDNVYTVKYIDEFCLANPKNNTPALCREILEKYQPKGLYYYGDASGRHRDTRNIENDYDIIDRMFQKYLTNSSCRVPYSNPSHNKRRVFINKIFAGLYPISIEIDPVCKYLINDMMNVKEDIDGSKVKKRVLDKATMQTYEPLAHCSDALDYQIVAAFEQYFNE